MDPQFHCDQANRVREVRDQSKLNGIEFLEVATADQLKLRVVFVHPVPDTGAADEVPPGGAKLTADNFRIEGGVRIRGIRVTDAQTASNAVLLTVNARGDFSTYTLRLVSSPDDDSPPPAGYDPRLSAVKFSFKAACPSDFDCQHEQVCLPEVLPEPAISYLAKDYASFRRLMLDRLSTVMPDWRDRSAADPLVTLVEALAYTADQLSYRQDAIATEAYLGTARRPVSLRRHARLLDYRMHDGCNARTWIHLSVGNAAENQVLLRGTPVFTRGADARPVLSAAQAFEAALRERPVVFETMHDVTLHEGQNEIAFHTWSDAQCCLPRGATRATLKDNPATSLKPGDWLLFEEVIGPETQNPADAYPKHRHVVRLTQVEATTDPLDDTPIVEIGWDAQDALPFPLCLSAKLPDSTGEFAVSIARGNLVLADHGLRRGSEVLTLEPLAPDRPPRASLSRGDVTFAVPFDADVFTQEGKDVIKPASARLTNSFLTAAGALDESPAEALPAVSLELAGETWTARRDLLASDRFAPDFVVELERDDTAQVRFGDGTHGERPPDDAEFVATYRTGNGRGGNVGRDVLVRAFTSVPGIVAVRNPLPASGGADPEPMEEVRQFAPQAFRRQERAVTTADWVEVSQRHPEVQRAAATFRWTGSWHTVFVTVDRRGGLPVSGDPVFVADFRHHLERFRLAGYDLEVNGPVFVPLDLRFEVCVKPGYFQSDVKGSLLESLSNHDRPDGRRGFFHPDNFSFGQPVYLSQLYAAIMSVAGVHSAEIEVFQRFGKKPAGELEDGFVKPGQLEIARCDNDPNFPENGRIAIELEGGL